MDPKYKPIEIQKKEKKRWPWIVLGVVLVFVILCVVFWYLNKIGKELM